MDKWEALSDHLKSEGGTILTGRNTPAMLESIHNEGLAEILEKDGEIIAYGGLWYAANGCLELGSFWVHPEERDKRLLSFIFEKLSAKIASINKKVFAITHVPKVIHLLEKFGWERVSERKWFKHIPFEASCAPCDAVEEKEKPNCPFRAKPSDCLMFFYRN